MQIWFQSLRFKFNLCRYIPGYPVPHAVGVPLTPPRIIDNDGENSYGCNDWPSACQPHFMLHSVGLHTLNYIDIDTSLQAPGFNP